MSMTQANAILNIAITGGTVSVLIESEYFNWNDGTTTLQWYEITPNANGVYSKSTVPAIPGSTVIHLVTLATSLATSQGYRAQTGATQIATVTAALQSYYNNQIGLANGTVQPVLT